MKASTLLSRLILFIATTLLHGRAYAATPTISYSVDFDVARSEQPEHLCVVTARGSTLRHAGAAFAFSLPMAELENGALQDGADGGNGARRFLTKPTEPLGRLLAEQGRQAIRAALAELMSPKPDLSCSAPGGTCCTAPYSECEPRVWVTAARTAFSRFDGNTNYPLHVACTANGASGNRKGRVVIVSWDFIHGEDLPIVQLRLDGSVASIVLSGVTTNQDPALSVLGGDYLPGRTYLAAGNRALIPLVPLCSLHSIRAPDVRAADAGVNLFVDNDPTPLRSCMASIQATAFDMLLPSSLSRRTFRLDLRTATLRADAQWVGTAPPDSLSTTVRHASFLWARDCAYPEAKCPAVRLRGVECSGQPDVTQTYCVYSQCEFPPGSPNFPISVDFVGANLRWATQLQQPGEALSAFVPHSARRIRIDLSALAGFDSFERRFVDGLHVIYSDGHEHYIDFNAGTSVNERGLPLAVEVDASVGICPEDLKYRYEYSTRFTEPKSLPPDAIAPVPACESSCGEVRHTIGIGIYPRQVSAAHPAQVAANSAYVAGHYFGEFRGFASPLTFGYGWAGSIGQREYINEEQSKGAAYARAALELAAGLRAPPMAGLFPSLGLGIRLAAGYGHVLDPGGGRGLKGDFYLAPGGFLRAGRLSLMVHAQLFEELPTLARSGERISSTDVVPIGFELDYAL